MNPTADPLRAASEFLTAHEAELLAPAPAQPEVAAESPPSFERANASTDVRDDAPLRERLTPARDGAPPPAAGHGLSLTGHRLSQPNCKRPARYHRVST